MTRETMRRWKWIGGGVVLLAAGLLYYFTARQKPEEIPEPIYEAESSVIETSSEEEQKIYVHVGGAVLHPDEVYILEEGDRVVDAIEKAGGCSEDADLSGLNLAEPLKDGQKIYVPRQGESIPEEINPENDCQAFLKMSQKNFNISPDSFGAFRYHGNLSITLQQYHPCDEAVFEQI